MEQVFTESDIDIQLNEFSTLLSGGLSYSRRKEILQNITTKPDFNAELRSACGVYYFIQEGKVQYVGRALPSVGLRARIVNQVTAFGDMKWDTVINDMKTEVGVIIFENPAQWYFISALEHYLIEKLGKPSFNKRC